jgi:hypothetical protein
LVALRPLSSLSALASLVTLIALISLNSRQLADHFEELVAYISAAGSERHEDFQILASRQSIHERLRDLCGLVRVDNPEASLRTNNNRSTLPDVGLR